MFLYRIFNISSGKQKKLFKGSQGEDGTLIKVRAQEDGPWAREREHWGTRWKGTGASLVLCQLCVLLHRCRRTPQGSTSPPAVLTRTSPFLTSPQASAWPPCLATQVSVAPVLCCWNFTLSCLSFLGSSRAACPSLPTNIHVHCWDRSLAGTSGWLIGRIPCSSQRLSLA